MEYYPAMRVIKLQLHTMWMNLKKKKPLKNNQPKCVAREARFKLMHMYNFI